jgi:hypothetical protein
VASSTTSRTSCSASPGCSSASRSCGPRSPTPVEEVGVVTEVGDGIARVEGLYSTMANELLEFEGGVLGLALNLDEHEIGASSSATRPASRRAEAVRRTGGSSRSPSATASSAASSTRSAADRRQGPARDPLDGARILEVQAPRRVERQPVNEPLQTGIKAIDAMTPIGRGQRQLIIGDRQTGKTAVAIDTIINQRENWVRATRRSRSSASTSPSARRARRSPRSSARSRRPARWSTRPSSPPRASSAAPASSTSPLHRLPPSAALDVQGRARR